MAADPRIALAYLAGIVLAFVGVSMAQDSPVRMLHCSGCGYQVPMSGSLGTCPYCKQNRVWSTYPTRPDTMFNEQDRRFLRSLRIAAS